MQIVFLYIDANNTLIATHSSAYRRSTHYRVYAHNTSRNVPIFGFRGDLWTIAKQLQKTVVPPVTAYMALEKRSLLSIEYIKDLWVFFNCVSFDCAAHIGLFRKHYLNCSEDSLMMAPMKCRNM